MGATKILNILNGDATLAIFNQTQLEGDVLVWREILSEGPVAKTDLWLTRSAWICSTFGGDINDYQTGVIAEVERLKVINSDTEIVLWFEYDLVCQINLIYILSVLNTSFQDGQSIYLICPSQVEGVPNFRGLGELNASQLEQLWPTKIKLQKEDLTLASEAWDVYLANEPDEIHAFLTKDFGRLPLLKPALNAHLLRYPKNGEPLNHIEKTLLNLISSGLTAKPVIYKAFWKQEPIFGIPDVQLDLVLKNLIDKKLIDQEITHS